MAQPPAAGAAAAEAPPAAEGEPAAAEPMDLQTTLNALDRLKGRDGQPVDVPFMIERLTQYLTEMKACIEACYPLRFYDRYLPVLTLEVERCVARFHSGELTPDFLHNAHRVLRAIRIISDGYEYDDENYLRKALLCLISFAASRAENPMVFSSPTRIERELYYRIKEMVYPYENERFDISRLEQDQDLSDLRALAEAWRERERERQRERRLAMAMGTHPRLSNELTPQEDMIPRLQQVWSFRSLPAELQKHILQTENRWPSSAAAYCSMPPAGYHPQQHSAGWRRA